MNLLLSLPPNVARALKELPAVAHAGCVYADSDPADRKLGSGGGTVWLRERFHQSNPDASGREIIIHAGGQSRRVPAYAASGKSLTPVPVMRWAVGEKIDQTLLDMQLPLLERIMDAAPQQLTTLVASGDALVRNEGPLPPIPHADVVCFGLWAPAELAVNHGVFFIPRSDEGAEGHLDFMLQKPSASRLAELGRTHYYLMDVGLWLLSNRAMDIMRKRSATPDGSIGFYDMYGEFGCAIGDNPSAVDEEVASLSAAIVPLRDGAFYHFGTTRQLLSSTLALQNLVADQRHIFHNNTKPNPALFVQNCVMHKRLTDKNSNVWVENSCVGPRWELTSENVITGVPDNDWTLSLGPGHCIDIVPIDGDAYAVRPYGFDDPMRGSVTDSSTLFLGQSICEWVRERGVALNYEGDIQSAPLFPVVRSVDEVGLIARWMISEPDLADGRSLWLESECISADDIMMRADLKRLFSSRRDFLRRDLPLLASNPVSVFYQLDLHDVAEKYHTFGLDVPERLSDTDSMVRVMRNAMLRSTILRMSGGQWQPEADLAFETLRTAILSTIDVSRSVPRLSVCKDQIVWGRSPVRIDLAGGWTDTPPYSLMHGGAVVNVGLELNGQPPLQVFIKPSQELHIVLRSIDLGAAETITDYESLTDFARVGSPFSIPKAALAIAGFAPGFSTESFGSLRQQLNSFGSGIEITLLSALPAGSGMGTSSILAATVLGSLSDFCGLAWTADEVCERTLALEQLLTTGGGWQDQYGGVLPGLKLLLTDKGRRQSPSVNWLPDGLFTDPEYASCHLLYYTGLTRTAKGILAEIVKRMFLNENSTLNLLHAMKEHTLSMADAIQRHDFTRYGHLLARTWEQNKALDSGTCPPAVAEMIHKVSDLTLGLKLPGAGGGGFLYMVAKDPEAAARIRRTLTADGSARFVEMSVSRAGLRVSRS